MLSLGQALGLGLQMMCDELEAHLQLSASACSSEPVTARQPEHVRYSIGDSDKVTA